MGRSKKKQEFQPQVINIEELEIENKIEIDYDKLAEAIVKAKQIEKENEEVARAKALAEWRVCVGYKEHNEKKAYSSTCSVFATEPKWFSISCLFLRKSTLQHLLPVPLCKN